MHERCAAQDGDRQRLQDHRMRAIMQKRLIPDAPMATLAHALRAKGPRRPRDFRYSRRFRAASVQGHRKKQHPVRKLMQELDDAGVKAALARYIGIAYARKPST